MQNRKSTMRFLAVAILASLMLSMCRKAEPFPDSEYDERLNGGSQTTFDASSKAFSHEFEGMKFYDALLHELGDAAFEQTFVTAPAPFNPGLGPAYNNTSCVSCHHNDGRGVATAGQDHSGLLMRISHDGAGPNGEAIPVPGYGTQIQDKAIFGKVAEARIDITYTYQTFSFPDGQTFELRTPTYSLSNLHTSISGTYLLSPRLAPPVFGLGLLEALDASTITQNEDVSDANGDGISGKANYVWDPATQQTALGRFGLKANTASILTQVAAAYNNDMGVTNRIFPLETTHGQSQTDLLGDDPELADSILDAVRFYIQSLQVPARRNVDDAHVIAGKQIFVDANCSSCHIPSMFTAVNVAFPQVSNQRIQAFTDLLLHDMGAGLADNRPDFLANGNEWRTTPLWGLGLIDKVNFPAIYLHDGRARTITEAIMWHGGEAEQSKEYFYNLTSEERDDLLAYLKSL